MKLQYYILPKPNLEFCSVTLWFNVHLLCRWQMAPYSLSSALLLTRAHMLVVHYIGKRVPFGMQTYICTLSISDDIMKVMNWMSINFLMTEWREPSYTYHCRDSKHSQTIKRYKYKYLIQNVIDPKCYYSVPNQTLRISSSDRPRLTVARRDHCCQFLTHGYSHLLTVSSSGHNVPSLESAERRQNAHFVCLSK